MVDPTQAEKDAADAAAYRKLSEHGLAPVEPPRTHSVSLPPHLGGEVKNIRRCLKDPKPDKAALGATLVAAGSAIWAVLNAAGDKIAIPLLVPLALALGAAVVGVLRFLRAREPDEHLRQAQADADILVSWHEDARVKVDRELRGQMLEGERARALPKKPTQ
jgi:hypothetical protein